MIKVFIVDDHQILIDAIKQHLDKEEDIECIGFAQNGTMDMLKIPMTTADVILMDISLPDTNGVELTKKLMHENPEYKIIGLSSHLEISIVKKMLKYGALGYVSKSTSIGEMDKAIRTVYTGEKYLDENISKIYIESLMGSDKAKIKSHSYIPDLTKREKEVLSLISEEFTTQEISKKLYISTNTVETHRKNLMNKFQVRNSVGLVKKALEFKLID